MAEATTVIVRPASRSEIHTIIELATESMGYSQSPYRDCSLNEVKAFRRKDLDRIHTLFGDSKLGLFVAEENGTILGHVIVLVGMVESLSGEEQGWIIDLSVLSKYWEKGIGKQLSEKAEKFVHEKGLKYIGLGVTSANERAVQFYEHLGYKEERKRMIKVLS